MCVHVYQSGVEARRQLRVLVLTFHLVSETESHLCCFLIHGAPLQLPLLVLYKDKKIFYRDLFSNILFIPSL